MKNIIMFAGWLMLFLLWVMGLYYFGDLWGPIGFFGAIIVGPMSLLIYILEIMLSGIGAFFQIVGYLAIAGGLIFYGGLRDD